MPDFAISTDGRRASGYLAIPASEQGPAVIILQERGKVDWHIRAVCDRLATEGFFALTPQLYLDGLEAKPGEADQARLTASMRAAVRDMRGVIEQLLSTSGVRRAGVGALGFGFGAGLAVWAATAWPQIVATVTYHYLAPPGEPDFAQIKGSVLGHFGTADTFISLKDAKALEMDMRNAGVSVEFEKYTGAGHGFLNDTDGLGTYDGLAAERSWRRSVGFLRANLAAPEPPSAA